MDAGLAAAAGERLGTAEAWADVEPGVGEVAATGDVAGALGVNVRVAADDGVAVGAAPVVAAGGDAAQTPAPRAGRSRPGAATRGAISPLGPH